MTRPFRRSVALVAAAAALVAGGLWYAQDRGGPSLGPADGLDLPAADTGRVAVGDPAPDFTLASRGGERVTLSSFRGGRNVVLVFYRGHW